MANVNIYDLTDLWNNAGTTYHGIKIDVTNAASAAGSNLLTLQIGGVDIFEVGKAGDLQLLAGDIVITPTAGTLTFSGATSGYKFADGPVVPNASDGAALGTASLMWSDLFLASGAVVNFDNSDLTITHSTNLLTIAGGTIAFDVAPVPTSPGGVSLGTSFDYWDNLYLGPGGVVNFDSDVTITHATNTLTFAGATSGYRFDDEVLPSVSGGAALGSTALQWADLFLDAGGVINFGNGTYTIIQAGTTVTFSAHLAAAAGVTAYSATAIPAGGTAGAGLKVSSTSNFGVFFGSGAPTLSAAKGSLYLRSDGSSTTTRAYINTDGATTWTAISTVA